jgi:hypothetical protein
MAGELSDEEREAEVGGSRHPTLGSASPSNFAAWEPKVMDVCKWVKLRSRPLAEKRP